MLTFNSVINFINKKRTGTLQQLFYIKFIQSETLKNVTKVMKLWECRHMTTTSNGKVEKYD